MNKEIKDKLPDWINRKGQYCLCATDDLDSLLSCYILEKYRNWDIKYFYDFYGLYKNHGIEVIPNTCIAVDADLYLGRCIGNHVGQYANNPNCINLNKYCNINQYNYNKKFAGSTLITILSLLDIPIDNFTIEQQEILLCIDSMFLSYYFNKQQATYYINTILSYKELIDILEKHDKNYFYNIQDKYKLKEKIYLDSQAKRLETHIKLSELSDIFNINLELPKDKFEKIKQFEIHRGVPKKDTRIFSLAWTYKNSASYSTY
ncbi:hypothetical protein [Clostridium tyrobutyricum]|uniref:hypothetical protein n=1 Tax=Clostridium tyrobutyricum TaxID=1519 RepID=UPI00057D5996|nr:hypothetical protein [Clostridium tyrobutyricum]